MRYGWRATCLAAIAIVGLVDFDRADARGDIVLGGSFGPNGDVGFVTSPPSLSISFGAATGMGSIYQMDGFVNVPGVDLGAGPGMSADLANGAPTGLGYSFAASQPTSSQLLLSYTFVNTSGASLAGFQFLQFTDADINPNSFNTDYATLNNPTSLGMPGNPSSFQVGDPALSTIFTNLASGMLSNVNELTGSTSATTGDVSTALGFSYGTLGIGQSVTFDVLLADDGSSLGNFSIAQNNANSIGDSLTISGGIVSSLVPEPSSLIMLAIGSLSGLGYRALRRSRQAWTRSQ